MATDLLSTPSSATVAGLFVAGLGAVYAYTQLGPLLDTLKEKDNSDTHTRADVDARNESEVKRAVVRKGKKKRKGKGVGGDEEEEEHEGEGKGKGRDKDDVQGGTTVVVPGDFEAVGAGPGSQEASLAGTISKPGQSGKTKKRKKKKTPSKVQDRDEDRDREETDEEGSETGKEVGVGRTAAHGPLRSGDSTDADTSVSVSASTFAFSRTVGKGNLRASTRLAPPSQPRAIRPSLSFDTDSSWTHVHHHRLKTSKSVDGQTTRLVDAMDVTSSDLASTEGDSPVAERTDSVASDIRGTRADLAQRTLAEKLVPRPDATGVEEYVFSPFPFLCLLVSQLAFSFASRFILILISLLSWYFLDGDFLLACFFEWRGC